MSTEPSGPPEERRVWKDAPRHDAARPISPALHLEHARTLRSRGALNEALRYFEQLVRTHGGDTDLLNAFGLFLQEVGDHHRAISVFRETLALARDHPGYRFNLGLSLLTLGKLDEGWPLYEEGRRLHRADPVRRYRVPEWRGEPLNGKTVYLWEEQGIGDTLLFGSMIRDLEARGARCILEGDARLASLFRRSFPALDVVASGPFADMALGGRTPDFHAPLGSIGRFLRPALADFPPPRPFLKADPDRVAALRTQLAALGPMPKIGLSWRSASASYSEKSIPIAEWEPILSLPNLHFVALQYGDCRTELADISARFGIDPFDAPGIDRFQDIDGVAALAQACDAVVTISNVTANIAGALGRPTLLLLGPATIWYWFHERPDSPW